MEQENLSQPAEQSQQRKNAAWLEAITPLAKRLNCLEMDKIADVCINEIPKLIGARRVSLYILDESSDILHLEKNNHPFLINNIVSLNQNPPSPMVAAVRSKELMLVNDMDKHTRPNMIKTQRAFSENYSTKSCIIAPLICHNRVVGVLNLTDKDGGELFTTQDIAVLELFRQLIGASIGNVKLFEKTQRQAKTDGLTGMLNHRTFYETLETELRRTQRYGGKLSVIMADVDHFKPVNDTFGHRAGDAAIKQISRHLSACIRQIDIAARYGGDEFAFVLPNTSLEDAVTVAERMVKAVAETPIIFEDKELRLTLSVGVGQYGGDNCSVADVTKTTDLALYAAKLAGRNTVRVVSKEDIHQPSHT